MSGNLLGLTGNHLKAKKKHVKSKITFANISWRRKKVVNQVFLRKKWFSMWFKVLLVNVSMI